MGFCGFIEGLGSHPDPQYLTFKTLLKLSNSRPAPDLGFLPSAGQRGRRSEGSQFLGLQVSVLCWQGLGRLGSEVLWGTRIQATIKRLGCLGDVQVGLCGHQKLGAFWRAGHCGERGAGAVLGSWVLGCLVGRRGM